MRRFGDFLLARELIVGVGSVVCYGLDIIPTSRPQPPGIPARNDAGLEKIRREP